MDRFAAANPEVFVEDGAVVMVSSGLSSAESVCGDVFPVAAAFTRATREWWSGFSRMVRYCGVASASDAGVLFAEAGVEAGFGEGVCEGVWE